MRLINGKISFGFFLPVFGPADNSGGNGSQETQDDGNQSQGGQQGSGKAKELDPDSDTILDDLMGDDDAGDEDSLDIDFEEQEEDDPEEQARITASTKNLGEMLKQKINGLGIKADDIPEDFDASDRSQVAELLGKTNRQVAEQVISVIPEILKHALGVVVPKLEKKIQSASVSTSKKNEASKAFNGLGLKGADRTLGVSIYKAGIARGMSPDKAARATAKAISGLRGGSDKGFNNGNGNKNRPNSGSGLKEGKDALDSMFGS